MSKLFKETNLESFGEKIKDTPHREAFVYIGPDVFPNNENGYGDLELGKRNLLATEKGIEITPYNTEQWVMVDQGDGKGPQAMIVSAMSSSVERARKVGFNADHYKHIGRVNDYRADTLGYTTKYNDHGEPALEGDELEMAIQKWHLNKTQAAMTAFQANASQCDGEQHSQVGLTKKPGL